MGKTRPEIFETIESIVSEVGIEEWEDHFNRNSGQPNSGQRNLIRLLIRDKGTPVLKMLFMEKNL